MLLKGIKVLDLSALLPGPMCSLFLGDLGAEVIKIESLEGDFMRSIQSKSKSPFFSALNRNKKSIALNLKTKEGRNIFLKLAKDADVIIEGSRPGKIDSLGLGYKDIKKVNSKIIYCSITGYGQKIAENKAGHDLNYSALSGLLDILSEKPIVPGVQIADVGSAMAAAFSIASSLFYRERSKKGNYIDVSIFSSTLSLISMHIAHHSLSTEKTVLSGNKPCYNVYETKDGRHAALGAIESKFWQSFCNAVNRKDFLARQFDESIINDVRAIFRRKNLDEWVKLNDKTDFCCEPVKKIKEVVNDRNLNIKKILIEIEGVKQAAFPAIFSSFGKMEYSKSPKLGQHTAEILESAGYSAESIIELRNKGIIK